MLVYYSFFFFKQKTAYEMRISDWSSDVCSSDLAHCAAKKASSVCLAALSDVADGAGVAACRQAAGAAAISAASSRCLNMEGSPEWKSGSLARGVVDAGVPKVGRLRPDRSTCGSGRGPGAAPTCATWSGCRGLVPNYAARSVSVVKLSPQPHSAATLGF